MLLQLSRSLTLSIALAGMSLIINAPSFSQNIDDKANPTQEFQRKDNPDIFSGQNQGQGVFDLLHRYRLGNKRNLTEFTQEQRQIMNDEANNFRAKQRQLIQQQRQQQKTGTEAINPITPITPASP